MGWGYICTGHIPLPQKWGLYTSPPPPPTIPPGIYISAVQSFAACLQYSCAFFAHRMSYRRQKRWWNAYILLYERMDNNKKELDKEFEGLTIGKTVMLFLLWRLPLLCCIALVHFCAMLKQLILLKTKDGILEKLLT